MVRCNKKIQVVHRLVRFTAIAHLSIWAPSVSLGSFHLTPLHGQKSYVRCASNTNRATDRKALELADDDQQSLDPCNRDYISWMNETQTRKNAEKEMYQYLYSNLMPFDLPNAESLGFHVSPSQDDLPDGLSMGIVGPSISIALDAKQRYSWTDHVPKNIYFEYVGSFASANESRNDWRTLFQEILPVILQEFELLEKDDATVEQVIQIVNQNIWNKFRTEKPIYFKSGQTPLIYDPMSILAYGYASCTGLSIFLVDLLRTVGVPARLAGTAAWNGKKENGNHSWVEFYGSDSNWHIMEAQPASGGDDKNLLDPCQWWFCNEAKTTETTFHAARLDRNLDNNVIFPLAWDSRNGDVIGEDRTSYMRDLCSQC